MTNTRNRFPGRRRFLKQSAALTAASASIAPILVLAQTPSERKPAPNGTAEPSPAEPPVQGRRPPRSPGEGR